MAKHSQIAVVITDHIATVTINRPEARNALNRETMFELTTAFNSLSVDPTVRCVLLRGSGDSAFCAGADLQELKNSNSPEARRELFSAVATLIQAIEHCAVPVISLVYGFALAGGLGLIAASDIAIASDEAQFGLPEVAVGLAPLVVTAPLIQAIGVRALNYLALTGERIHATEALRIGLINRIASKESALNEAILICGTIAKRGPTAVRATKAALRDSRRSTEDDFIFELADRSALVSLSDEADEGIKAFIERRSPRWPSS
jgi:enoyl-CoA hydratase/carnithine racemase